MQIRLADATQTAVLQLRDAIRRATATHLPADGRNEDDFLAGVDVTDSTWGEWQDTTSTSGGSMLDVLTSSAVVDH
jgi:hypothetical protein